MKSCFNIDYKIFNPKRLPLQIRYKGGISYELHDNWEDCGERVYVEFRMEGVDLTKLKINPELALTNFDRRVMDSMLKAANDTRDLFLNDKAMLRHQNLAFVVYITTNELDRKDAVHSEMFGFTLYLGKFNREVYALNTPSEALNDLADTANVENSVNASFKLVDPERRYNGLWTNVFGRAVKIESVRNTDQQPGLYLFCEGESVERIQCYYGFNEIDNKILRQYGIFMSEQEAINGGNTDELIRTRTSLDNTKKENRELFSLLGTQRLKIGELSHKLTQTTDEVATLKAAAARKEAEQKFLDKLDKKRTSMDTLGGYVKNASIMCGALLSVYKAVT